MFWGLIMEPKKRYSQVVENPFHISMAAVDIASADTKEPTQVMACIDGRNYLVCTLQKDLQFQCPLDLNFGPGEEVAFATNGGSHVHLTGYILSNDDLSEDEADDPFGEEEEEEDDDEAVVHKNNKRKAITEPIKTSGKKLKTAQLLDEIDSKDEDDSDDSEITSDIFDEAGEEEDSNSSDDNEEEDDDEDDDAEEVEEEEDEDENDSDNEEVFVKEAAKTKKLPLTNGAQSSKKQQKNEKKQSVEKKTNGVSQKTPTNQQQQQQQQTPAKANKKKNKTEEVTPKVEGQSAKKQKQADDKQTKSDKKTPKGVMTSPAPTPQKKTVEGGVLIEDIKLGNGQIAKPGKYVQVYYEGRLKSTNKMFDSSTKGAGFKFRLGSQEVIKGWDVGFAGMKVGGKRRITCPPNMGYGSKGSPPVIPPNSTLVFEVELKNVS